MGIGLNHSERLESLLMWQRWWLWERESENEHEKSWSLVPLISSYQQVAVIRSVCECVIVMS